MTEELDDTPLTHSSKLLISLPVAAPPSVDRLARRSIQ